ncbi:hypothetical protein BaRGS_00007904, partial [Batillaria attramentaria]
MSTIEFYHYTDQQGKAAILRSRSIMASSSGAYGPGVYGTTISPEEGRKKVSQNNWDGGWEVIEGQGRADCAFKIRIPVSRLKRARSNRDILIHTGDIHLDMYPWDILEWPGDGERSAPILVSLPLIGYVLHAFPHLPVLIGPCLRTRKSRRRCSRGWTEAGKSKCWRQEALMKDFVIFFFRTAVS